MTFTKDDVKRVLWTFVFAAVSVAIASASDLLSDPSAWKTVIVAALAAGLSAVKNLVTPTDSSWK